jgi:adenylate kinase
MEIARLLSVLGAAGLEPTPIEVAEAIWLSSYASAPQERPRQPDADPLADAAGQGDTDVGVSDPNRATQTMKPVAVPQSGPHSTVMAGFPIRIPEAPALPEPAAIQRALRPLKRRRGSPRRTVVDHQATVRFIASTGIWSPILRPAPERWFEVALVIDDAASMPVWRALLEELRAAITQTGAFRDVRVWHLIDTPTGVGIAPRLGGTPRPARELIDPSARRLFLIVSDTTGAMWHTGAAAQALAVWARHGSVAVLQPLPERLWLRTGLPARAGRLQSPAPGAANAQIRFTARQRRRQAKPDPCQIVVPIVHVSPAWINAWARLVAASSSTGVDLAAAVISSVDTQQAGGDVYEVHTDAPDTVRRFAATASPDAFQLAICLSAAPLTIPVMRLVQHVTACGPGPATLAEFLLGGLVEHVADEHYEFRPGVRELLAQQLRTSEAVAVTAALSTYLVDHGGEPGRAFTAAILNSDGEAISVVENALTWIPPDAALRMGAATAANTVRAPSSTTEEEPEPDTDIVLSASSRTALAKILPQLYRDRAANSLLQDVGLDAKLHPKGKITSKWWKAAFRRLDGLGTGQPYRFLLETLLTDHPQNSQVLSLAGPLLEAAAEDPWLTRSPQELRRAQPYAMRVALIGPPGAGKGTQAEFIAAHLAVPKISTGDIFRANIAAGTPLGVESRRYLDAGQLVPDEVTINMVRDRLAEPDSAGGFLLDGFPRTVPQARALDKLLSDLGTSLDLVLELMVDDDEVLRRLGGRRTCRGCGKIWHVEFDPPSREDVCDRCGGQLFRRDDDTPETIAGRLEEYAEKTAPLVDYYGAQNKLGGIDGTGPVEDVTVRAIDALRSYPR